jgi:hypothetical protein
LSVDGLNCEEIPLGGASRIGTCFATAKLLAASMPA